MPVHFLSHIQRCKSEQCSLFVVIDDLGDSQPAKGACRKSSNLPYLCQFMAGGTGQGSESCCRKLRPSKSASQGLSYLSHWSMRAAMRRFVASCRTDASLFRACRRFCFWRDFSLWLLDHGLPHMGACWHSACQPFSQGKQESHSAVLEGGVRPLPCDVTYRKHCGF